MPIFGHGLFCYALTVLLWHTEKLCLEIISELLGSLDAKIALEVHRGAPGDRSVLREGDIYVFI